MSGASADVLWVDDLSEASLPVAGSKIARLGELRQAGLCVPDGFVVTTHAFLRFMRESGAAPAVAQVMSGLSSEDSDGVAKAAQQARDTIEQARMPDDIRDALVDAYEDLSYRSRDLNIPVAVRSSATGEDGADASFAGQFDTYLGVTGPARVAASVQRCWGSLFTERAVGYRLRNGLSHEDSPMAVGVLELVHARASGVAFSVHPVSGNPHRMVIEGSWGWGEAVVQGLVTPDHIEVGKTDRRLLSSDKVPGSPT